MDTYAVPRDSKENIFFLVVSLTRPLHLSLLSPFSSPSTERVIPPPSCAGFSPFLSFLPRVRIDKFVHHPFAVLYQTDLAFPGYGHDAPSFHWKYDSVIESLIRNNPPSSRRSKAANATEELSDATSSANAPQIGHRLLTRAQRKDIKKVHVPQGIVMQYEGELVNFLDQLTLSDDESEDSVDECNPADALTPVATETEAELLNWVVVEKLGAVETQPVKEVLVEKKNETAVPTVPAVAAVAAAEEQEAEEQEAEDEEDEERLQVYLRWDIQDQFLRFVAHALVAFYGLVSFSKYPPYGSGLCNFVRVSQKHRQLTPTMYGIQRKN